MGRAFVYDGVDLSPYIKCRFERPLAAPVAIDETTVPGRNGAAFRAARLEPLDIPVHVRLDCPGMTVSELRRTVAGLLVKDGPKALVLPDEQITRYAVLSGASELDRLWESGAADLVFHCPDPVGYGATARATVPSAGSVEITVGGNMPTYPVVSTRAAVRDPDSLVWGIRLDGGDFMHMLTGISTVRYIDIDCGARVSTRTSNKVAYPLTLDSDWFVLEPGTHTIENDQGTGACTVTWVERWL